MPEKRLKEWELELLFSEFQSENWVYRRNSLIGGKMVDFAWAYNGLMVIAPEIQLLYKSRSVRDKDERDFHGWLPLMSADQKKKLREWIAMDSGEAHPWCSYF